MKHFLNISGLGEATTEQLRTLDALSEDSPKLTEGAAIALMIDDLIRAGSTVDRPIKILDVTTIMLPGPRRTEGRKMRALTWTREPSSAVDGYVRLISDGIDAYPITHHSEDRTAGYFTVLDGYGKKRDRQRPLVELLSKFQRAGDRKHRRYENTPADAARRAETFWTYIAPTLGNRIWNDMGLRRHLMNDVVEPKFRGAVDIDTVVQTAHGNCVIETKHKFPFCRDGILLFGINVGELDALKALVACGAEVLHVVVVKPYHDKQRGSAAILLEAEVRERTMVLTLKLDRQTISDIRAHASERAQRTTRDGVDSLETCTVPASWFRNVGVLADPQLGHALADEIHGIRSGKCTDAMLLRMRQKEPARSVGK